MIDTSPVGIANILKDGESETAEFKVNFPSNSAIANIIAAFANSEGGILLIGVDDDGRVSGLSEYRVNNALERLDRITDSLLPNPVQIGFVEIESRKVVYAVVEQVPSQYYPIMTSSGRIYERRSNKTELREPSGLTASIEASRDVSFGRSLQVFVAMSFRDEEEPSLVDYFHAMKRAADRLSPKVDLKICRLDQVEGDYEISQRIMDEINAADIVIAYYTLNSPNVYFEVGYARGLKKHIIQTARKETTLEFDCRNWRTIFYRNATELEEKLTSELISVCFESL